MNPESALINQQLRRQCSVLFKIFVPCLFVAALFSLITVNLSQRYSASLSITAMGLQFNTTNSSVVWMAYPTSDYFKRNNLHIERSRGWECPKNIFISTRNQPAEIRIHGAFPISSQLEFLQTPYSGQAQLEVDGTKSNFELRSDSPSTKVIKLKDHFAQSRQVPGAVFSRFLAPLAKNFLLLILLCLVLVPFYNRYIPVLPVPERRFAVSKRLVVLAVFIFGLLVLAFYPGVMNDDSVDQYAQAVHFRFNDWHPPIMAALWSVSDHIIRGPGGMFLLHLAMLCCSGYLLSSVAETCGNRWFLVPVLALLLPMVSCISFYIVKDTSFVFSMLLALSLWLYWRSASELTGAKMILIFLILFYSSSVRLNGLTAILPLIFLFLMDFFTARKAFLFSILLSTVFIFGNHYLTYDVLKAARSYNSQVFISHDLMAIYDKTGQDYFPSKYLSKGRLDELMKLFDPVDTNATTWIDHPFLSTDPELISQLKSSWVMAIKDHPVAYLDHRWLVFRNFLTALDPWIYDYHPPKSWHGTLPLIIHSGSAGAYQSAGIWFRNHFPFLFQTWTYALAAISIFGIAVLKRNVAPAALSLSAILYVLPYFFVAPGADYRYVYPLVFAVLLALFTVCAKSVVPNSEPIDCVRKQKGIAG